MPMEHMVPCRLFASRFVSMFDLLCSVSFWPRCAFCFVSTSQGQIKKSVLMINELGQSHPGPVLVRMRSFALHSDPQFDVELYLGNLDATDISKM